MHHDSDYDYHRFLLLSWESLNILNACTSKITPNKTYTIHDRFPLPVPTTRSNGILRSSFRSLQSWLWVQSGLLSQRLLVHAIQVLSELLGGLRTLELESGDNVSDCPMIMYEG